MNQLQYDYPSESCQPYSNSKESPDICAPNLTSLTLFQNKHCIVTSDRLAAGYCCTQATSPPTSWTILLPSVEVHTLSRLFSPTGVFQYNQLFYYMQQTVHQAKPNLYSLGSRSLQRISSPHFIVCLGYSKLSVWTCQKHFKTNQFTSSCLESQCDLRRGLDQQ